MGENRTGLGRTWNSANKTISEETGENNLQSLQKKIEGFYREKKRKAEKTTQNTLVYKITVLFMYFLSFYFYVMKH